MKHRRHVDLVMPCWNNLEYTKKAVESFLTRTDPKETHHHLILIDNGCDDGTGTYFAGVKRRYPDRVVTLRREHNVGWVDAVNIGVDHMCPEASYFACVNNDVLFTQDNWLLDLIKGIEDKAWLAGAGPVASAVAGRQNVVHNNPKIAQEETTCIIGFCALYKRQAVELLIEKDGFFMDPAYSPGGFDEIDVAMRLADEGYRFLIDRKVYVHHFCSKSLGKITSDIMAFHKDKIEIGKKKHGAKKVDEFLKPSIEKVLIGIPTVGMVHHKFLMTVLSLAKPDGVAMETVPRCLPDVARNKLAIEALERGFDYIFYLDDDMLFNDQDLLLHFVEVARKHPSIDVISPLAYMRNAPFYPCTFRKSPEPPYCSIVTERGKGLLDVDATTCAATLVRVAALRRLEENIGHRRFFEWTKMGNEQIGEDVSFCFRIKETGGRVVCDTDRHVYHIGDNLFIGPETFERNHTSKSVREVVRFSG